MNSPNVTEFGLRFSKLKSPWATNPDSNRTQGANLIILIIIHPIPQGEGKGAYDKYDCNYKKNYF